jgi:DNA-nicking Smr family endonuclease
VKKPRKGGSGDGHAEGDHEIWSYAAASIEPLKRRKSRVRAGATDEEAARTAQELKAANVRSKSPLPDNQKLAVSPPAQKPKSSPSSPPPLATFDRNSARKIRGGREKIEARVDLHGMRQDEAHATLRRFLFSCHDRGLRFVLIITGKGKALGAGEGERGILKRNVPRWLAEPELRGLVVSFATAAIQHGGEGALYVHIRSKARA